MPGNFCAFRSESIKLDRIYRMNWILFYSDTGGLLLLSCQKGISYTIQLIIYSRKGAFPVYRAIDRFKVTGIIEIILFQPPLAHDIDIVDD